MDRVFSQRFFWFVAFLSCIRLTSLTLAPFPLAPFPLSSSVTISPRPIPFRPLLLPSLPELLLSPPLPTTSLFFYPPTHSRCISTPLLPSRSVGRQRTSETSEEFSVLGSTGNQYKVTVGTLPDCSCPDGLKVRHSFLVPRFHSVTDDIASKGNTCKHRLFVLLKILQIPQSSNLWFVSSTDCFVDVSSPSPLSHRFQSALLTTELQAIFAHARPAPRTQLDERVARSYRIATGQEQPEAGSSADVGGVKKRIPEEGDSCPICCAFSSSSPPKSQV